MAIKHALVVDDSKSARIVLRRMLEDHDMVVDTAESAEEALDFLSHHRTDVVFMDHTMPGMDGLQAVQVIKDDPRTAMIPVVMYTAKEGELYVGQARALGAIGVLPKQVRPAEVFKVLSGLGLVAEKRHDVPADRGATERVSDQTGRVAAVSVSGEKKPPSTEVDRIVEGVALKSLLERMLVDQRTELRKDILASHTEFARHVATGIFDKERDEREAREYVAADRVTPKPMRGGVIAALTLLPALFFLIAYFQNSQKVDRVEEEKEQLIESSQSWQDETNLETDSLQQDLNRLRVTSEEHRRDLLETIEWAINQGGRTEFGEISMNNKRATIVQGLLERLSAVGFEGVVRLESHLGEFCMTGDEVAGYTIADKQISIENCDKFGHPLDNTTSIAERQSVSFANFLASSPILADGRIQVEVAAYGRERSERKYPFPPTIQTAGEWNRTAALNDRIEISLISSTQ